MGTIAATDWAMRQVLPPTVKYTLIIMALEGHADPDRPVDVAKLARTTCLQHEEVESAVAYLQRRGLVQALCDGWIDDNYDNRG